jgi:hypothetical protein
MDGISSPTEDIETVFINIVFKYYRKQILSKK